MVEPRALSFNNDRWLTDSRVYNLIWLGRWLERADNITRVVNTFAGMAVNQGSDMVTFQRSLNNAAVIRGIMVDGSYQALTMLLKDHGTSSVYHSLVTARSNATQVGTLELIRAIHDTLLKLEDSSTPLNTPQDALMLTTDLLDGLGRIYQVIDDSWFHQEALSEEEVFRRFVQQ